MGYVEPRCTLYPVPWCPRVSISFIDDFPDPPVIKSQWKTCFHRIQYIAMRSLEIFVGYMNDSASALSCAKRMVIPYLDLKFAVKCNYHHI